MTEFDTVASMKTITFLAPIAVDALAARGLLHVCTRSYVSVLSIVKVQGRRTTRSVKPACGFRYGRLRCPEQSIRPSYTAYLEIKLFRPTLLLTDQRYREFEL